MPERPRPRRRRDDDNKEDDRTPPRRGRSGARKPPPRKGRRTDDRATPTKRIGKGRPPQRDGSKRGRDNRTSRNSDERNPTVSGIQYPRRRFKSDEPEPAPPRKSSLRRVRSEPPAKKQSGPTRRNPAKARPAPRRRARRTEATEELARVAGRRSKQALAELERAADAFQSGRERDALRILRPLRDAYPDATAVRELMGLAHYRIGNYVAAAKELDAYVELSGSVEQHPVLMDCARAQQRHARVEELWRELADTSPSGAVVTEGRIVLAGDLADRGRLRDAIDTLERKGTDVKRVQEHHLRLWYALADLYERAGEIPSARQLFERVAKRDPGFADVAERLSALG
jgi:tetratricopeptide (TPR) repeat protein